MPFEWQKETNQFQMIWQHRHWFLIQYLKFASLKFQDSFKLESGNLSRMLNLKDNQFKKFIFDLKIRETKLRMALCLKFFKRKFYFGRKNLVKKSVCILSQTISNII